MRYGVKMIVRCWSVRWYEMRVAFWFFWKVMTNDDMKTWKTMPMTTFHRKGGFREWRVINYAVLIRRLKTLGFFNDIFSVFTLFLLIFIKGSLLRVGEGIGNEHTDNTERRWEKKRSWLLVHDWLFDWLELCWFLVRRKKERRKAKEFSLFLCFSFLWKTD